MREWDNGGVMRGGRKLGGKGFRRGGRWAGGLGGLRRLRVRALGEGILDSPPPPRRALEGRSRGDPERG